jgi:hypothetical protein
VLTGECGRPDGRQRERLRVHVHVGEVGVIAAL